MEMPRVLYLARYLRTYTQGAGEHRHDFYQIFLPASPEIRLLSGGKVFIPGEDEVVLVSPARMHVLCVLENIPQPTKFSYNVALDCKFELSDPALVKQLKKLPMLCRVRNMETLRKLADGMIDALLRNASEETLSVILQTLLTLVINGTEETKVQEADLHYVPPRAVMVGSVDISAVKGYIDTHYAEKFTLEGLSRYACVNKTTLCRSFRSIIDMSPIAYVTFRRVEVARGLLRETSMSVGEIARAVGYGNIYHFSRQFREVTGKSPTEYRRLAGELGG